MFSKSLAIGCRPLALASGTEVPRREPRASYLENKYETPIVNPGLFSQALRDCRGVKIGPEPSGAVW
jgi:hypothetical protein